MIPHRGAASAKLRALLLLLAAVPLAALGWLAWNLLAQDRAVESEREHQRLTDSASLVTRELTLAIGAWQDRLDLMARGGTTALPPDAAVLRVSPLGATRHHGAPLPWVPVVAPAPALPAGTFAYAEARELRDGDPSAAALIYRGLASSTNPRIRAAALVGLGRCLMRQRRHDDAVTVYGELATLGETPVAGFPAALIAHQERARIFEAEGDTGAAARERREVASLVESGAFLIDRPTFDVFAASGETAGGRAESLKLAEATEAFWNSWREQPSGRSMRRIGQQVFASIWRPSPDGIVAAVEPLDSLLTRLPVLASSLGVTVALDAADGTRLWGSESDGPGVTDVVDASGFRWNLRASLADSPADAIFAARANVMAAVFGVMALVMCAAAWSVYRSVAHELRIARLQADFLAAVSHEFRTPLSAMSHLAEVLQDGRGSADHLPDYYRAIAVETRRLQELVEGLLDFGRTEAGGRTYRREDVDLGRLVDEVVARYRDTAGLPARRIEVRLPSDPCLATVDRDAMALVVRNLVDNAVKYSPESSTVDVSVSLEGARAAIAVEDRGAGIPRDEQRDVFRKFVRGRSARELGVKGTGIGLAMARHVVGAHGGRLSLSSEPGRGSRFTVHLPALAASNSRSLVTDHP